MDENLDLNKNREVQKALKEFEEKDALETAKIAPPALSDKSSKMAGWIIKHSDGAIKDERRAEYVLLGFAVIVITASVFLFFRPEPEIKVEPPAGQKMIYPSDGPPMLER